ncbi:MAG: nuclear transport factor 2 family protein [Bacteroidota bacterium]
MAQHNTIDELSPKQREVWENVQNYTKLIMKNDVKKFLDYFHNNYSGWNYYDLLPVKKSDVKNELWHLSRREITSYKITPVAINVFKEVAVIHYYYSVVYKDKDGNDKTKSGRNTDVLLKQKNKWLLIADHVGVLKNKTNKSLEVSENENSI